MRHAICLSLLAMAALLNAAPVSPVAAAQPPAAASVLKSVPEEYIAGAVVRPSRILESRVVATIVKSLDEEERLAEAMKNAEQSMGIDPREIEEMTVLLDRKTIFSLAGLPVSDAPDAFDATGLKNQLKQVGLAMHNIHDVYNHFPDHDGVDTPDKGNLSWRVHLLPFLDHARLYNKFHKDEPWDSEHNKTLIDQMPEIFQTPGVKDKTKTSLHGIVGDNTIMTGKGATGLRDILDGSSNTIMFAVAGPDKAEIWTKPGGVELKDGGPPATLGKIGKEFFMARCDGSVTALSSDMKADIFQALVTRNGGEVIPNNLDQPTTPKRLPTWIVRSRKPINQTDVLESLKPMGTPEAGKVGTTATHTLGEYTVAFPDERTLVAAPADLLPKILANAGASEFATRLRKQTAENDLAAAVNFKDLKVIKDKLGGRVPMAGLVQAVESLQLTFDVGGTSKQLNTITADLSNEQSAAQLSALLQGLVQMQKAQMLGMANAPNSPIPGTWATIVAKLYDRVEVKPEGKQVHYSMSKPEDMDAFLEELKPSLVAMQKPIKEARAAARRAQRRNNLKQMGLAFHNYHDVYRTFPRYNGDANPKADDAKRGLSWRVHLLPFVDGAQLYEKFHLDEPWDSEHNKTLIEEMPDVFKTEGVAKPGHTAMHVFIGEDTAFGDGTKAPGIRDYTDGTSNTFLAVEAGPDTAEIWTKPGGLKFTGKDSIELLGKIGDSFLVLMCDGAVRNVSKDIEADQLNNLIQHNDGNVVGDF